MPDSCQKLETLGPEEAVFLFSMVLLHNEGEEKDRYPGLPILSINDFDGSTANIWGEVAPTLPYGAATLFGEGSKTYRTLVSCSPEQLFNRARRFFQEKHLVLKEERGRVYLKQTEFFEQAALAFLNAGRFFLKGLSNYPSVESVEDVFIRLENINPQYVLEHPQLLELAILTGATSSDDLDIDATSPLIAYHRARAADSLRLATFDWKHKRIVLHPNDIRDYARRAGISVATLRRMINDPEAGGGNNALLDIFLKSLSNRRRLDLTDELTARRVAEALYELGEYEKAWRVWQVYAGTPSRKIAEDQYKTGWLSYLKKAKEKAQRGEPVLREYEFFSKQGPRMRPFSELIGSSYHTIMPSDSKEVDSIFGVHSICSYLPVLGQIQGPSWTAETSLALQNPRDREKALLLFHETAYPVGLKSLADFPPSPELRILVDPEIPYEEKDLAQLRRWIPPAVEEARLWVETYLRFPLPENLKNHRILVGFRQGDKNRSHANCQGNFMFLDWERPIDGDMLAHEWGHLLTPRLCELNGPYVFLTEGISLWLQQRYLREQKRDPQYHFYEGAPLHDSRETVFYRPKDDSEAEIARERHDYRRSLVLWEKIEEVFGMDVVREIIKQIVFLEGQSFESGQKREEAIEAVFKKQTRKTVLEWLQLATASLNQWRVASLLPLEPVFKPPPASPPQDTSDHENKPVGPSERLSVHTGISLSSADVGVQERIEGGATWRAHVLVGPITVGPYLQGGINGPRNGANSWDVTGGGSLDVNEESIRFGIYGGTGYFRRGEEAGEGRNGQEGPLMGSGAILEGGLRTALRVSSLGNRWLGFHLNGQTQFDSGAVTIGPEIIW